MVASYRPNVDSTGGDTSGAASSTDNAAARFDGTGGKTLQNSVVTIGDTGNTTGIADLTVTGTTTLATALSGLAKLTSGVISAVTAITSSGLTQATGKLLGRNTAGTGAIEEITLGTGLSMTGTTLNVSAGTGDFSGPGSSTDNAIVRFDGTGGKTGQNSAVTVADTTGAIAGCSSVTVGSFIGFPATQSASAGANDLDDYEEGTWTPALKFGGGDTGLTYTSRNGYYTKIGNRCFLNGTIIVNALGSSTGNITLEGLPFTALNSTNQDACFNLVMQTNAFTTGPIFPYIGAAQTVVTIYRMNNAAGGGLGTVDNTDVRAAAQFTFSGQYATA